MIDKLAWDSIFFDFEIGRYNVTFETDWELFRKEAGDYKVVYIFSDELIQIPSLLLVDTKVTFEKKNSKKIHNQNHDEILFEKYDSTKHSYSKLLSLAYLSGSLSRFKLDPKFGEYHFKKLYKKWIDTSIAKKKDTCIWVALFKNEIVGFVTCDKKQEDLYAIGLIAVAPNFQGRKIASQLILCCENEIPEGYRFQVSTQETNFGAKKLYLNCVFQIKNKINIYHYWNE